MAADRDRRHRWQVPLKRSDYVKKIEKHGGKVVNSVTKEVDLLISTPEAVEAKNYRVVAAKGRKVPIVTQLFVLLRIAVRHRL